MTLPTASTLSTKTTYGALNAAPAVAVTLPAVCVCILAVELCERLAFYTFTGTQEFFLEHVGYSLAEAGGLNAAMGTLCMTWAIFAGWCADVVLGRYWTILVFGLIYAMGSAVAALAAWPSFESSRWYLIGVMLLVPLGTAGIKANISNFGADQYDTSDPAQLAAQEKFFSWFYLAINLGSAVAYGFLTTLGSNGGIGVPKLYGYFAVYTIAAICMVLAVAVFCSARKYYRIQQPMETSSINGVARHVLSAARAGSPGAAAVCSGVCLLGVSIATSVLQAVMPEASFAHGLTNAAFLTAGVGMVAVCMPCVNPKWLQASQVQNEAEALTIVDVVDVQRYLRLLPPLFSANMAFSALYNSMQFWYQQQACQMDVRMPFSESGAQFAGSFFMIADCLGIVIATPIAVGFLNPLFEGKLGGYFGHGPKFGLGIVIACCSVIWAARLEQHRRETPVLDIASNCAPTGIAMSTLSASWMIGPYFLMGLGEIYTQPVLMHFAYSRSPPSMRTLTAATGLIVGAVSNALFTVQIAELAPYVPNDLNKGHLEYGYFTNIGLGAVFYAIFMLFLRSYEENARAVY